MLALSITFRCFDCFEFNEDEMSIIQCISSIIISMARNIAIENIKLIQSHFQTRSMYLMAAICVRLLCVFFHPFSIRISMFRRQEMLCDRQTGAALLYYTRSHIHILWNPKAYDVRTNERSNKWQQSGHFGCHRLINSTKKNYPAIKSMKIDEPFMYDTAVSSCCWLCLSVWFLFVCPKNSENRNSNHIQSKC